MRVNVRSVGCCTISQSEQDLADWIEQSGIVDTAPPITQQALDRGRALREAMFRLVATLIDHQTPNARGRALVNAVAKTSPPLLRLDDDGLHRYGDTDAVLALLARDCLDLFDSPDRAPLHWCADLTCTRAFIDRSRGQRRRWCGMKGCGNRAKAAEYRRRRRIGLDNQTGRDIARQPNPEPARQ